MNIICNNCVGARIYQQQNVEFNNPFMWCRIYPQNFFTLIKCFEKINFENITLFNGDDKKKGCVGIRIDNKIDIYFTHYLFSEVNDKPIVSGLDVLSKDNFGYAERKYRERLKRMYKINKNDFVFLLADRGSIYTTEDLMEFINLQTKYRKILFTDNKEILDNSKKWNNGIIIIPNSDKNSTTDKQAKEVISFLMKNKIKQILN